MNIEFNSVGIKRPVDDLGRIVLPKDLRLIADVKGGEEFEIFTDKVGNFYLKRCEKK